MEATPTDTAIARNAFNWIMVQTKEQKSERVPQDIIDALLLNVSLLDLIKESTPVRIKGGQHRAHCPFHVRGETDTTLLIDIEEQRFTCSECEFHGSAIGWLLFHDGQSFQDSIYEIADLSAVDISQWITPESIETSRIKKDPCLKTLNISMQIS